MTSDYSTFLANKVPIVPLVGIDIDDVEIHPSLFPFQRDLVRWALRKGRSAIFATTGMGKTRIQIEWARLTDQPTLFIAPLAVAQQTIREAQELGVDIVYARSQNDAQRLTITNYEMSDRFDASQFGAVVLDESSILKSHDGKTRTALIEQFNATPFRLCCTATPAPNDTAEMANHAEFLGIMSRVEMLAMFFVHDDQGWRLKGHAREPFYRWLASWGMSLLRPSDLGYDDGDFQLPPLTINPVILQSNYTPPGQLFATSLKGITDRANVRKSTVDVRVAATVKIVRESWAETAAEPWIVWVGLNSEQEALAKAFGDDAISVYGSLSAEEKARRILSWIDGDKPVLLTKVSIAGFGLNLQRCANMAFVGLSDSYESYFQAIRRCYRFGQTRPVTAHIVLTEPEEAIYQNVLRKEQEATDVAIELVKHVASYERAEIGHARQGDAYEPTVPMELPSWLNAA